MSRASDRNTLVIISDPANGPQLVRYAELLLGHEDAHIHVVRSAGIHSFSNIGPPTRNEPYLTYAARECISHYPPRKDVVDFARGLARTARLGLLIADWVDAPDEFQPIIKLAVDLNLSAVFLRCRPGMPVHRVLIPMNGGPHTLQQLWVAKALASSLRASSLVLRIVTGADQGGNGGEPGYVDAAGALARLESRIVGIDGPVAISTAEDVVSGIAARRVPGDMIVMGAPNYWRAAEHFEASTPHLIAARFDNPLAMLLARRPERVRLRDVFWEETVCPRLNASNKGDAIASLVDALVQRNQVPAASRGDILSRALGREADLSTAVGCETAFPHIAIDGFSGIIGCLGMFPQGVEWAHPIGQGENEPVKFVFLLISSANHYGDLLAVLSKIARLMVLPGVRQELLACSSSRDVLGILQPN